MNNEKPGVRTTEFWLTLFVVGIIYALIYQGKLEAKDGMEYILIFAAPYLAVRQTLKGKQ